jgi:hypothetical protein
MLALNDIMQRTWGDPPSALPGPFPVPPPELDLPDMYPPPLPPPPPPPPQPPHATAGMAAAALLETSSATSVSLDASPDASPPPAVAAAAPAVCIPGTSTVASDAEHARGSVSTTSAGTSCSTTTAGGGGGGAGGGAGGVGGLTLDMRGISNTRSPPPGAIELRKVDSNHELRPVTEDEWWPDAIAAGACEAGMAEGCQVGGCGRARVQGGAAMPYACPCLACHTIPPRTRSENR